MARFLTKRSLPLRPLRLATAALVALKVATLKSRTWVASLVLSGGRCPRSSAEPSTGGTLRPLSSRTGKA
eukprot:1374365-Pyramimonas_sp.AAC.1